MSRLKTASGKKPQIHPVACAGVMMVSSLAIGCGDAFVREVQPVVVVVQDRNGETRVAGITVSVLTVDDDFGTVSLSTNERPLGSALTDADGVSTVRVDRTRIVCGPLDPDRPLTDTLTGRWCRMVLQGAQQDVLTVKLKEGASSVSQHFRVVIQRIGKATNSEPNRNSCEQVRQEHRTS